MDYETQFLNFGNGSFGQNLKDMRSPHTPIDKGIWKPLPGYRLKTCEMPINTPTNTKEPKVLANYRICQLKKPLEAHKPIDWS